MHISRMSHPKLTKGVITPTIHIIERSNHASVSEANCNSGHAVDDTSICYDQSRRCKAIPELTMPVGSPTTQITERRDDASVGCTSHNSSHPERW